MPCPPEIAEVVLEIIQRGLVRVRLLGWSGQSLLCAEEADHLHNLPSLVADYSDEKLSYYWNIERRRYVDRVPPEQSAWLADLWDRLRHYAETLSSTSVAN